MRLHSRGVLLTIIAVVAMSVVTAASASAALPEFKPVPTKKKFTSTSGKVVWNVPSEPVSVTCSKSTASGEITGVSTIGKTVIKFTGCNLEQGSKGPCPVHSTNTTNAGELVTNGLKGELGTVKMAEAASGVGMLFESEAKYHELFELASTTAPCTLGGEAFEGNIAAEVSSVAKKQLTNDLVFGSTSGQKIKEITVKSGTVKPKLDGLYFGSLTTLENTDETTFEEALEVTL
jgi:hypothetical protein